MLTFLCVLYFYCMYSLFFPIFSFCVWRPGASWKFGACILTIKILNHKSLYCKFLLLAKRATSHRRVSTGHGPEHGGHYCSFTLTSPPMSERCGDHAGHERTKINAEVDFHRCTLPVRKKRWQSDGDAACFLQFDCNVSFELTPINI